MDVKEKLSNAKSKAIGFAKDHAIEIVAVGYGAITLALCGASWKNGFDTGKVTGFRFCDILTDRILKHDPSVYEAGKKLVAEHAEEEAKKLAEEW